MKGILPSKLEYVLSDIDSKIASRYGAQKFNEFLRCCQGFVREDMVSRGLVVKGSKKGSSYRCVSDGKKYYPNDFYQDSELRRFIRNGISRYDVALFFVSVIRKYYAV